jgi:hypothetical protein
MQRMIKMSKYYLIVIIVLLSCTAQGTKYMPATDRKYIGILHNVTPGRLNYQVVNINKNFWLSHKQIINSQWQEKIPNRIDTYPAQIRKMICYNNVQLYFISYLYNDGKSSNNVAIDLAIKDVSGSYQYYCNLKEFANINFDLDLAKIIDGILFYAFSDDSEILYAMDIFNGKYDVKQYNHKAGIIKNIWPKIPGGGEYLFTSERNNKTISGLFKITGQHIAEVVEMYDYEIIEYDNHSDSFFCYNRNKLYYKSNDSTGHAINEFMDEGEEVCGIFFPGDDSFLIVTTKTSPDHFSNLFFGSGNLIHHFYYYRMRKQEQKGNYTIKKIKTFNSLWKLEQLIK